MLKINVRYLGFSERCAFVRHIVGRGTDIDMIALPVVDDLSHKEKRFLEKVYSADATEVSVNIDSVLDELCYVGPKLIDFYVNVVHLKSMEEAVDIYKKTRGQNNLFWRKCRQVSFHVRPICM